MQIQRRYTRPGADPLAGIPMERRTSRLVNPDGSVVFEAADCEVPAHWSQTASDIVIQKYFRKAGVPAALVPVDEGTVPDWLRRSVAAADAATGPETSARQVFHRMAGCWTYWGWLGGYFGPTEPDAQMLGLTAENARAFYDEVVFTLAMQMAAPNSPQWFNTGLAWAYGLTGPAQGHFYADPATGQTLPSADAYTRVQAHACLTYDQAVPVALDRDYVALAEAGDPLDSGGCSTLAIARRARAEFLNSVVRQAAANGGTLPVGLLVEEQLVGLVVATPGGPAAIEAVQAVGLRPAYRVELADGSTLEATGDHRVLAGRPHGGGDGVNYARNVQGEWLTVADLVPGMCLYQRHAAGAAPRQPWPAAVEGLTAEQTAELRPAAVVAIEDIGLRTVFDIQTATGTFFAGSKADVAVHNCFINRVDDDLVGAGGIMDLWLREARIFKYGSGAGSNVSGLRGAGEPLSGGGKSSGLMSFLKVGDRSAGAIKSGGTCLAAGTRVYTSDGPVPVGVLASLGTGDWTFHALSYDPPAGRGRAPGQYTFKKAHAWESGRKLVVRVSAASATPGHHGFFDLSADHPVWLADGRVVPAGDLKVGDALFSHRRGGSAGRVSGPAQSPLVVESVQTLGEQTVYDVEVEDASADDKTQASGHNFVVWPDDDMAGTGFVVANTRRAAKMVVLDLDHPDIEEFVNWKVVEEQKVADLVAGSTLLARHMPPVLKALRESDRDAGVPGGGKSDPRAVKAIRAARRAGVPDTFVRRALELAANGLYDLDIPVYTTDWNSEGYTTVSGQNSNNSVRVSNAFMDAVAADADWHLYWRTEKAKARRDGREPVPCKTLKARALWDKIAYSAWACADPGVQYDDLIDEWHTCPAAGRQRASNPCSEFLWIDDSSCFTGEMRVSTPDGLRTFDELYASQEAGDAVVITTDIHGESDHRRLTAHHKATVTRVGVKPVFRMSLTDGRMVRATADHRFLTEDGWKRLDQLKIGADRLCVRQSGNPIRFDSSPDEVRRWQMLGWLTADGVFSKGTAALTFGGDKRENAQWLTDEFNALIAEAREQYGAAAARTCHLSEHQSGVLQTSSKDRQLVLMLEERYGMVQGTATHKDVPAAVHRIADDLKVAYLQGLFSGDGFINKAKVGTEPEFVLSSSAPNLMRSVQLLLSDLGIVSRITWHHPDGRTNPQGHLHITNQQGRKFAALIGFPLRPKIAAEIDELLTTPFEGCLRNPRPTDISAIEPDGEEVVYDITEPVTRSAVVEGLVVHNCNLASLNLLKFYDAAAAGRWHDGLDAEGLRHVARLWTLILEITVHMAHLPSREIAHNTWKYRTLGLGFANLGALLMVRGLPYDSPAGRNLAAAVTALLHFSSAEASAELARDMGPFPGWADNAEAMLRVMRNHLRAAGVRPGSGEGHAQHEPHGMAYEGLTVEPVPLDRSPEALPNSVLTVIDRTALACYHLGSRHGFRNAQVTNVAPTGTISLAMDCDTSGIEPDFALVKFKKLAGGGYLKIVNQSVPPALRALGYSEEQIAAIGRHATGVGTLRGAPHLDRDDALRRGLTEAEWAAFDAACKSAFDVTFAFNPHTLGAEGVARLGVTAEQAADPDFRLLAHLGLTPAEVDALNDYVVGTMTVEGAPHLKAEHLAVFDCANRCGKKGDRYIAAAAHIEMLGAAQPFISGGISKTVNTPPHATIAEIKALIELAYRRMVKCVAVYRDGSKLSQPLNTAKDDPLFGDLDGDAAAPSDAATPATPPDPVVEMATQLARATLGDAAAVAALEGRARGLRRRLPDRRLGWTQKARIGSHKVYLRTGEYADGTLGEIFVDLGKEGAAFRSMVNAFAIAVSLGLQHGVPLDEYVDAFTFFRFEPNGMVQGSPCIKVSTSIIDYIFRELAVAYLGRHDLAHVELGADDLAATTTATEPDGDDGLVESSPGDGDDTDPEPPGWRERVRLPARRQPQPAANGHAAGTNGYAAANGQAANGTATLAGKDAERQAARERGYTADPCETCGQLTLFRAGKCLSCATCGNTTGCG